jgi:uncharacterized protein (TIGR02996 family)
MSDAEAFEKAIIANPEERATYSAYADWLQERDDPRGEFIAVQLALEDESRSKNEREALKSREAELLAAHKREWLGELAPHFFGREITDPADPNYDWDRPETPEIQHEWRRGLLFEVTAEYLTVKFAQALVDAPVARTLQKLCLNSTAWNLGVEDNTTPRRAPPPPDPRYGGEWLELLGSPLLRSLRVFQMGGGDEAPPEDGWNRHNHIYVPGLERVIAEMTHIEELHLNCKEYDWTALFALPNLTNLRVLQMYALGEPYSRGEYEIQLDALANNPALGNLTHLQLHPHYAWDRSFIPLRRVRAVIHSKHLKKLTHLQLRLSDMGDDGIRAIIDSGILKQLRWLDLRHGCITDESARLLAACPDAKRLERIDVSYNGVTATGLAAMRNAKINAVANNPLTQSQLDSREFLQHGDYE